MDNKNEVVSILKTMAVQEKIPDFFDIRFRALAIAGSMVLFGGLVGIAIHFATKGLNHAIVPAFGLTVLTVPYFLIIAYRNHDLKTAGKSISIIFAISIMGIITFSDGLRSALLPMICGVPGFAALFWTPRGSILILISILIWLAILVACEVMGIMPHIYFEPYPALQNAGFVCAVFNSLMMVAGTGFFYVSEQNAIKNLIHEQMIKASAGENARARFLSTITHELRTPLNGIAGTIQLLDLEAREDQKQLIGLIKASANELAQLVDSILITTAMNEDLFYTTIKDDQLKSYLFPDQDGYLLKIEANSPPLLLPLNEMKLIISLLIKISKHQENQELLHIHVKAKENLLTIRFQNQGRKFTQATFNQYKYGFDRVEEDDDIQSTTNFELSIAYAQAEKIGATISYEQSPTGDYYIINYKYLSE